jgi:hypothetical protein
MIRSSARIDEGTEFVKLHIDQAENPVKAS